MKTIWAVLGAILIPLSLYAAPQISEKTYEITGPDISSGKETSVKAVGKGLVVVFLSAVCPCSDSHITELKSLHEAYPDFSFVAIHSNADESAEAAKKYFDQAKLPFSVIQDQKGKWLDQFKALKTPHAFVIKTGGEIVYQGGVSDSHDFSRAQHKFLREALEDVHADHKIRTAEGRTLGCAIAREDSKNVW
jgi:peroxiredoxin